MSSCSEASDGECLPTLEDLQQWKKKRLIDALSRRGKKISGNKPQLIIRFFKALNEEDSSSNDEDSDDTDCDTDVLFPGIHDPFWCEVLTDSIPPIKQDDIDNYFVYRKNPITGQQKNCKRQLKKAKKFAQERDYIGTIYMNDHDKDFCHFKTTCKPSMKDGDYQMTLTVSKKTGAVYNAVCSCKAGQTGTCAHIGALLIRLVAYRDVCTSRLCAWKEPRNPGTSKEPSRVVDICFGNLEKTSVRPFPDVYQASACKDPDVFLADLLEGLGDANPTCVLYKTLCVTPPDVSYILNKFQVSAQIDDNEDLFKHQSHFSKFVLDMSLTKEDIEKLESVTRGQATNSLWKEVRTLILTSSNFGHIIKRKVTTPPDNLVKSLRGYRHIPDSTAPLAYGRRMEKKALRSYAQLHMTRCGKPITVEDRGLLLSADQPFLGTSVDGVVDCSSCGIGLVEIKCPYLGRNKAPQEAPSLYSSKKAPFCAELDENNHLKLSTTHNYYYQVMGQMAISGKKWVDFVIWTKSGEPSIERIHFDEALWKNMIPKLQSFYEYGLVAELYTGRVRRGIPLYCS